jgi:hypothetical protein
MVKLLIKHELKEMWREAVVAYFKALSRQWTGKTEKNPEESQSIQPIFEPGTPE